MQNGCAVLLCLVCLFDLACFFLSSFSSLIQKHVPLRKRKAWPQSAMRNVHVHMYKYGKKMHSHTAKIHPVVSGIAGSTAYSWNVSCSGELDITLAQSRMIDSNCLSTICGHTASRSAVINDDIVHTCTAIVWAVSGDLH